MLITTVFLIIHLSFAAIFSVAAGYRWGDDFPSRSLAAVGFWLFYNQVCYLLPSAFGLPFNAYTLFIVGFSMACIGCIFLLQRPWPKAIIEKNTFYALILSAAIWVWYDWENLNQQIFSLAPLNGDVALYHIPTAISLIREGFWFTQFVNFPSYFFGHEAVVIPFIYLVGDVTAIFTVRLIYALALILSFEMLRHHLIGAFRLDATNLAFFASFVWVADYSTSLALGKNDLAHGVALFVAASFFIISHNKKNLEGKFLCAALFVALAGSIKPTAAILGLPMLIIFSIAVFRKKTANSFYAFTPLLFMFVPLIWMVRSIKMNGWDIVALSGGGTDTAIWNVKEQYSLGMSWIEFVFRIFENSPVSMLMILGGVLAYMLTFLWGRQALAINTLGGLSVFGVVIAVVTPHAAMQFTAESFHLQSRLFSAQAALAFPLFLNLISKLKPISGNTITPPVKIYKIGLGKTLIAAFLLQAIYVSYNVLSRVQDKYTLSPWGIQTGLATYLQSLAPSRLLIFLPIAPSRSQLYLKQGSFSYQQTKGVTFNSDLLYSANQPSSFFFTVSAWRSLIGDELRHRLFGVRALNQDPQLELIHNNKIFISRPDYVIVPSPLPVGFRSAWVDYFKEQPWARLAYEEPQLHVFEILPTAPWRTTQ